jgi:hypothetical protein
MPALSMSVSDNPSQQRASYQPAHTTPADSPRPLSLSSHAAVAPRDRDRAAPARRMRSSRSSATSRGPRTRTSPTRSRAWASRGGKSDRPAHLIQSDLPTQLDVGGDLEDVRRTRHAGPLTMTLARPVGTAAGAINRTAVAWSAGSCTWADSVVLLEPRLPEHCLPVALNLGREAQHRRA